MRYLLCSSALIFGLVAMAADGQQLPSTPKASGVPNPAGAPEPSRVSEPSTDPTAESPQIDRVLSQIRQLDELRTENKQLLARLQELETRSQRLADVDVRGVIVGSDGAAAALLQFDGQTQLVRPGSEIALVSRENPEGAQRTVLVKQIVAGGVQLQVGGSSEVFFVR